MRSDFEWTIAAGRGVYSTMDAPKKRPIMTAAREVKRAVDGWKAAGPAALELLFIPRSKTHRQSVLISASHKPKDQGGRNHVRISRSSTTACCTRNTSSPAGGNTGNTGSSTRSDGECTGGVRGGDGVDGSCEGGYVACAGSCEGEGGTACGCHDGEDGTTNGCGSIHKARVRDQNGCGSDGRVDGDGGVKVGIAGRSEASQKKRCVQVISVKIDPAVRIKEKS